MLIVARDHVAFLAIVADAAATDMIENDAVPDFEFLAIGAGLNDLAARLVTSDGAGTVTLVALAEVGAIDGANVAAADRAGAHLDQYLPGAGSGNGELAKLDGAIAGQNRAGHVLGFDHKSGGNGAIEIP
jgi:hypothetical protein